MTNLARDESSEDTMSVLVIPPRPDDEPPQSDDGRHTGAVLACSYAVPITRWIGGIRLEASIG